MIRFDTFEEYGEYFGYPECCIQAFMTMNHMHSEDWRRYPLHGTGFVCCPTCAESKTEQQLMDEINARRDHPRPFPDDRAFRRPHD